MADALLVYNPAAGRISVRPFIGGVIRTLNDCGWRVEVAESMNGRHTTQLARMAAQENFCAVFAVGGDGTAGQTAAGLIGSQTALAVLPAGSTNVWARDMKMPVFSWKRLRALRDDARLLASSPACAIDVGMCNDQPFLLWTGIGLDAITVKSLEPRQRIEKYLNIPEFIASGVQSAVFWHGMHLRVTANEKLVEGHYLLAVASNIRHYLGGLVEISPRALLDDGEMDLWLFSGSTLADAFRHFFDLQAGRHVTSDQVRCIPFRKVQIESETPFSIQVDAEPMLGAVKISLEVLPQKLHVLMPPEARTRLCHSGAEPGQG
jgi:diacylglycerol kinase (ATP)